MKYSIKYPQSWKVLKPLPIKNDLAQTVLIGPNPERGGMMVSDTDETYIEIHISYLYATRETIEKAIENFRKLYSSYTKTEIKFADQNAYKFVDPKDGLVVILIPYQGELYYIFTDNYNLEEVQKSLSTFKFIK